MSVIASNHGERQIVTNGHPRPASVPCSCGGEAIQRESISYHCFKCGQSKIVFTGFDDPAWF